MQNVGRNVSGSLARAAQSVFAPFLCVAREIWASLRHFPIVWASDIVVACARAVRARENVWVK